jgi:nudix-type nucleoside diphosphatase (YffH/AdpP family)
VAAADAAIERVETLAQNWHPLRLVHLAQRHPDGSRQVLKREVYDNGQGAAVLPHDPSRGTVLLTRQLRVPPLLLGEDPMLIEACAGVVEGDKTPEQTVIAEAEQEMGCKLPAVRQVFTLYSSPGACAERIHLFLAEYDEASRTGAGGGLPEEGEAIEVLELPLEEAWTMARHGAIRDAKTVLLLQHLLIETRGAAE